MSSEGEEAGRLEARKSKRAVSSLPLNPFSCIASRSFTVGGVLGVGFVEVLGDLEYEVGGE